MSWRFYIISMLEQKIVQAVIDYLSKLDHSQAIANDKIKIRSYLRKLTSSGELMSYALDYSEKDFRISLISKGGENIIRFNMDNTIEDLGYIGIEDL